ncbi:MAG: hypothetical protein Q8Q92_02110, partial [bacterium]|nr:hypothetical protein [bacterium]
MISYRDLYIIKWLLENTQESHCFITWYQGESGMYFADFGEGCGAVCVEIGNIPTRTGGRVFIKFSSPGLGEVHVLEPLQSVFSLRKKYDTPEETELANKMNSLLAIASQQHATREASEAENMET